MSAGPQRLEAPLRVGIPHATCSNSALAKWRLRGAATQDCMKWHGGGARVHTTNDLTVAFFRLKQLIVSEEWLHEAQIHVWESSHASLTASKKTSSNQPLPATRVEALLSTRSFTPEIANSSLRIRMMLASPLHHCQCDFWACELDHGRRFYVCRPLSCSVNARSAPKIASCKLASHPLA